MANYPMNLSPMTELDGVNCLLMGIGQAPVNSLDTPGNKDAAIAQLTLFNINRQVQARGWWFGREYGVPLTADANGNIAVPSTAIQLEGADPTYRVIQRGAQLYDLDNRTTVFPAAQQVLVDMTTFLDFSVIPQVARDYITMRATRVFQTNFIGSQVLYTFNEEQVAEAYAAMVQNDTRAKRSNLIDGDATIAAITNRRVRSTNIYGSGTNIFNR